jgi:hypothetical protein
LGNCGEARLQIETSLLVRICVALNREC